MELSRRMQAVADLLPYGHVAADVGCDHGFVSIYLIQKGICPHVYAADVRPGPLQRAKEHIAASGLEDHITTVLSDGLKEVPVGMTENFGQGKERAGGSRGTGTVQGAEVMIAAGMGGKLTIRILSDVPEKTQQLIALVVEPQSEVWLVRRWLRDNGFVITAENMVYEEGKYYPVIQAVNASVKENAAAAKEARTRLQLLEEQMAAKGLTYKEIETVFDRFGPMLIWDKSIVLLSFLQHTIGKDNALLKEIPNVEKETAGEKAERLGQRIGELKERIRLAGSVLKMLEKERSL